MKCTRSDCCSRTRIGTRVYSGVGCSKEPSRGICVTEERYKGTSVHWRNLSQVPLQLGLAKHRHWERPQYSAFSSSWLGLGRLLPGMEPGGEGPSLKLLGRS